MIRGPLFGSKLLGTHLGARNRILDKTFPSGEILAVEHGHESFVLRQASQVAADVFLVIVAFRTAQDLQDTIQNLADCGATESVTAPGSRGQSDPHRGPGRIVGNIAVVEKTRNRHKALEGLDPFYGTDDRPALIRPARQRNELSVLQQLLIGSHRRGCGHAQEADECFTAILCVTSGTNGIERLRNFRIRPLHKRAEGTLLPVGVGLVKLLNDRTQGFRSTY